MTVKRRRHRIIKDKKERGEWAESVFVSRAKEEGLAVSKPSGDSQSFDCVVGRPGKFAAVQVKSTVAKLESGKGYICSVCSSHKVYRAGAFDFVAAYVIPEDAWYIIPAKEIRGLKSISLCTVGAEAKYEKYREAWKLLREASGVSEEAPAGTEADAAEEPEWRPGGIHPAGAESRLQACFRLARYRLENPNGLGRRGQE